MEPRLFTRFLFVPLFFALVLADCEDYNSCDLCINGFQKINNNTLPCGWCAEANKCTTQNDPSCPADGSILTSQTTCKVEGKYSESAVVGLNILFACIMTAAWILLPYFWKQKKELVEVPKYALYLRAQNETTQGCFGLTRSFYSLDRENSYLLGVITCSYKEDSQSIEIRSNNFQESCIDMIVGVLFGLVMAIGFVAAGSLASFYTWMSFCILVVLCCLLIKRQELVCVIFKETGEVYTQRFTTIFKIGSKKEEHFLELAALKVYQVGTFHHQLDLMNGPEKVTILFDSRYIETWSIYEKLSHFLLTSGFSGNIIPNADY